MRTLLATVLLASLAPAALAQAPGTYAVVATQADLDDGGTLSGAVPSCLTVRATGPQRETATFFDAASGQVVQHEPDAPAGVRTAVLVTTDALTAAASADIAACHDAADERLDFSDAPTGVVFFALSATDGRELVVRVDPDGVVTRLTDGNSARGTRGLVEVQGTLFLARAEAAGAPASGVYRIDAATPDQTPTPVLTDAGLDPVAIGYTDVVPYPSLGLFVTSSSAGTGELRNALVAVTDFESSAPGLVVVAHPCDGPEPLFSACDGLGDLLVDSPPGRGDYPPVRVLVANRAPAGSGADEVVTYDVYDTLPPVDSAAAVFAEAALVAQTSAAGFTAAPGALATLEGTYDLLLAGTDEEGAEPGLYSVVTPFVVSTPPPPAAGELSVAVSPNPTAGAARLELVLAEAAPSLTVEVYDVLGRRVAVLYGGPAAIGTLTFALPAALAPGAYVVVARLAGEAPRTQRFSVVR